MGPLSWYEYHSWRSTRIVASMFMVAVHATPTHFGQEPWVYTYIWLLDFESQHALVSSFSTMYWTRVKRTLAVTSGVLS